MDNPRRKAGTVAGANGLRIVLGLVVLTTLVHLHPFLEGNDDGNIGVYVVGARAWLHGVLPYTTIWEYKPPGLFAVYALALVVTGDGSRAAALLDLLASLATALILWRLLARIGYERAGVIAAVLWTCLSIENDGLLGDAELLTVPFVAGSLLVLAGHNSLWRVAVAGLLAGCAVQMKLTAAPVVIAPALAAVLARGPVALFPFGAALFAPAAAEVTMYQLAHRLGDLYDANVGATLRRVGSRSIARAMQRSHLDQIRLLSPAWELAPWAVLARERWVGIMALWLALALTAFFAVGEYEGRHFVPLIAPLAALGGIGLDAIARRVRAGAGLVIAAAVATFALHGYFEAVSSLRIVWEREVVGQRNWRISDVDRLVQRLRPYPLARDGVWFVEETPMLYDRLGVAPPTRYPLTSVLFNRALWPMLGFSGSTELTRIVRVARPVWIVVRRCDWCDQVTWQGLMTDIHARYELRATIERQHLVYHRIQPRAPATAGEAANLRAGK